MWTDVVDLQNFYASPLGKTARQLLCQAVRKAWPSLPGLRLGGYGFANPYLTPYRAEVRTAVSLMPAAQGASAWPDRQANRACLVEEDYFPLPDLSLDRLIMVHGLEHATRPGSLLREAWRALDAEGRLLLIVPNRRGLWARVDGTPFGWGQPFSRAQVTRFLNDMLFEQLNAERSLFMPPTNRLWLQRSAPTWERLGGCCFPRFGGLILIEARKRLIAPGLASPAMARRRVIAGLPSLTRRGNRAPAPAKGSERRDLSLDKPSARREGVSQTRSEPALARAFKTGS